MSTIRITSPVLTNTSGVGDQIVRLPSSIEIDTDGFPIRAGLQLSLKLATSLAANGSVTPVLRNLTNATPAALLVDRVCIVWELLAVTTRLDMTKFLTLNALTNGVSLKAVQDSTTTIALMKSNADVLSSGASVDLVPGDGSTQKGAVRWSWAFSSPIVLLENHSIQVQVSDNLSSLEPGYLSIVGRGSTPY